MILFARNYFFRIIFGLIFLSQPDRAFAQARLVFGTTSDAYMVMSSNAVIGGNPIYLVIGDATGNSDENTITRTTHGAIITNGENNIIKWYIGNGTGVYQIPYAYGTIASLASNYIPFSFDITTAGTANKFLNFSTFRTGWQNSAMMPTGVLNCWSSSCNCDASPNMIDRFWQIDNSDYASIPRGDLTFRYVDGGGTNPEVTTTGNLFAESDLEAESYNSNSNLWAGSTYGADVAASNYVSTAGDVIPPTFFYRWWSLVDKNVPLPVTWLDITAECDIKDVLVKWSTASEQNADFFTVERSSDGTNFSEIETVPASGNSSSTKKYSFVDTDPISGTSFYRIRETDFNGSSMTSSAITLHDCSDKISMTVFPNPATGSSAISVSISGIVDSEVLIVVTDMLGREFYSKVSLLTSENEIIAIDPTHQLAAGVYTVIASSKDEIQKRKIVIQ